MPELELQQCYLQYIIITNYKSNDLSIKKKKTSCVKTNIWVYYLL